MAVIRQRIFQDKLSVPSSRTEIGTDRFFALEYVTGRPETSVGYYHHMLRDIPEQRMRHVTRGGSQEPRDVMAVLVKMAEGKLRSRIDSMVSTSLSVK